MKIIQAKTAGFCMGVSLALKKLDKALQDMPALRRKGGRLITFGPIIHNPRVIAEYAEQGVLCLEDPKEIRPGDTALIRAHGIPRQLEKELETAGAEILDATCPKVKKAQLAIAAEQERSGGTLSALAEQQERRAGTLLALAEQQERRAGTLLLFGEAEHPEVKGLLSYAGAEARVFADPEEIRNLGLDPEGRYFLAAQTTQDLNAFAEVRARLEKYLRHPFPVLETICDATRERQEEALRLAREVDLMVVVGGKNSGNTRRLTELIRAQGVPVIHIESPDELDPAALQGVETVGLTAGASTPVRHVEAVRITLEKLSRQK